jgi:hypothetical protein
MPLDIQRGAFADSLRSLMRLSGRIPLRLDESVIATAIIADASKPPYIETPLYWSVGSAVGAVAGENSYAYVGQVVNAPGCLVVDRIIVGGGAAAYTGTVRLDDLTLVDAGGATVGPTPFQVNQIERARVLGVNYQTIAAQSLYGTEAALTGQELMRAVAPISSTLILEGPWVAPAGVCIGWVAAAVNTAIAVSFNGRYFPDVVG